LINFKAIVKEDALLGDMDVGCAEAEFNETKEEGEAEYDEADEGD